MATTNLLQWNPTATNQENDAAYLADSQRAGGATNPSLFASILANKAFYQWSTYLVALFTAFANKGFGTSDANLATLTAQCANFLTTGDLKPPLITIPYASVLIINAALSAGFEVLLTGNVSDVVLTGTPTTPITVVFVQDATGGRTVGFSAGFASPGTVDPTPRKTSIQTFLYLSSDNTLHPTGPMVVS